MLRTYLAVIVAANILSVPQPGVSYEPTAPPRPTPAPTNALPPRSFGVAIPHAQRLGPRSSAETGNRPRVVVSPWATEAPSRTSMVVSQQSSQPAPSPSVQGTQLSARDRWFAEVVIPAQLHELDSRIKFLETRLASNRERQERLASYNLYASPETAAFSPTDIWPGIETYKPVTVSGPVRSFSPRSSFSHVLATLERETDELKLELTAMRLKREGLSDASAGESASSASATDWPSDKSERSTQLASAEAELRLSEFRRQSYEAGLRRVDELASLTYLGGFRDLRDKLKLGQMQADLRIADIRFFQTLVRKFEQNVTNSASVESRVAAFR